MSEQQEKATQPTLFGDLLEESHEAPNAVPRVRFGSPQRRITAKDLIAYEGLISRFIKAQRSQETSTSYEGDIRDFFGGHPSSIELQAFLSLDETQLVPRLSRYRDHLRDRRLASNTVKRRLNTLRSLLRFAHSEGFSQSDGRGSLREVTIESSPTSHRELSPDAVRRLIAMPGRDTLAGHRDTVILYLLCRYALLRSILCALNVADYNPQSRMLTVNVRRQGGRRESVGLKLDEGCARTLDQYLRSAGHEGQMTSPLFLNLDRRISVVGQRLTIDGIYYLIRHYGELVGLGQQPGRHKQALNSRDLRHVAILAALEANSNDVVKANQMLPHISIPIFDSHRKR